MSRIEEASPCAGCLQGRAGRDSDGEARSRWLRLVRHLLLTGFVAVLAGGAGCRSKPSAAEDAPPPGGVEGVAFSPDGTTVVAVRGDEILLWDASTAEPRQTIQGPSPFTCVAFAADGSKLVTGDTKKTVIVWDAQTGKQLSSFEGHNAQVTCVTFSPNGKLLASTAADPNPFNKVFEIKLWDVVGEKHLADLPAVGGKGKAAPPKDAKGKAPAKAGKGGFGDGGKAAGTSGHGEVITAVAFSPDGTTLATTSFDGKVIFWDVEKRQQAGTLQAHDAPVYWVAYSPDGTTLATASEDSTVKLWDVAARKEVATRKGHSERVNMVAFSPDGQRVASGSDDTTARVWDVKKQAALHTLEGHGRLIKAVAISKKGSVVTGSADGTARLWDAAGKEQHVLK